jgi:hypothetical protein
VRSLLGAEYRLLYLVAFHLQLMRCFATGTIDPSTIDDFRLQGLVTMIGLMILYEVRVDISLVNVRLST